MNTLFPGQPTKKIIVTAPVTMAHEFQRSFPRRKFSVNVVKAMNEYLDRQKRMELSRKIDAFIEKTKHMKMNKKSSTQILREFRYEKP